VVCGVIWLSRSSSFVVSVDSVYLHFGNAEHATNFDWSFELVLQTKSLLHVGHGLSSFTNAVLGFDLGNDFDTTSNFFSNQS